MRATSSSQVTEFPRLIREWDVHERYGLSRSLLRKLRWEGGGPPYIRINTAIFYEPEAIEAFIASRRVNGGK